MERTPLVVRPLKVKINPGSLIVCNAGLANGDDEFGGPRGVYNYVTSMGQKTTFLIISNLDIESYKRTSYIAPHKFFVMTDKGPLFCHSLQKYEIVT